MGLEPDFMGIARPDRFIGSASHQDRQRLELWMIEQVTQAQRIARQLAQTRDRLGCQQGVAAAFEEMVVATDLLHFQHLLPDTGDLLLQFADGRLVTALRQPGLHRRQGLAVELAVGGQGQLFEEQQVRRDHVVRQVFAQGGLEFIAQGALGFGGIQVQRRDDHVGHQLLTARDVLGQDRDVTHLGLLQQPRFDFSQFDTEAADLHLMVDTALVFEHAIGAVTAQVTGAVQAFAGCGERIGHVFFGGHRRAAEVTTGDARAAQVQLRRDALGHWLQVGVEQVAGGVFERPADVRRAAGGAAGPGGIGGVFGWTVEVVDMRYPLWERACGSKTCKSRTCKSTTCGSKACGSKACSRWR